MLLPVCAEENIFHDSHADVYNASQADACADWHTDADEDACADCKSQPATSAEADRDANKHERTSAEKATRTGAGAGMSTVERADTDACAGAQALYAGAEAEADAGVEAAQDETAVADPIVGTNKDAGAESGHADNLLTNQKTDIDCVRATLARASPVHFNPLLLHCGLFDTEPSHAQRVIPEPDAQQRQHQDEHQTEENTSQRKRNPLQTQTTNRTSMRQHPGSTSRAHKRTQNRQNHRNTKQGEAHEDIFEFNLNDSPSSSSEVHSVSASSDSDSDYFESTKPRRQLRRSGGQYATRSSAAKGRPAVNRKRSRQTD